LSGVKATVFGGTSALGSTIGASLTRIGSTNIYPHRAAATIWDTRYKELRVTADLGHKTAIKLYDFTDEREIAHSFKDSNVVISTIGSKIYFKNEKEYEDANIRVPMAIAKAVKNNPKIKRFIYFGAAGSDPNSASRRLRTKWIGEQEVREICPEVTILRPTMIMNLLHPNPTFVGKWMMQMKMFNRTHFAVEGANALLQPVFVNDLVLAVMNCLKMEETIGQTYDLGGPHVYTYEEVFEMFANICNLKPYTVSVPMEDVCEMQN
jgi:NADH dehydrogenase (ubiquinone) 1 alpha subcomplex subunit 9